MTLPRLFGLALVFSLLAVAAFPACTAPTSTAANDQASQIRPHKLYLKYASSDDVLKKLGWTKNLGPMNEPVPDAAAGSSATPLPEDVDRVYAIEGDNSLLLFATKEGFDRAEALVAPLDVTSRKVKIDVRFVYADMVAVNTLGIPFHFVSTSVQTASGNEAVRLYKLTNKRQTRQYLPPAATVNDDHSAFFPATNRIPMSLSDFPIIPNGSAQTAHQVFNNIDFGSQLTVWPHVNDDQTATLRMEPRLEVSLPSKKDVRVTRAPLVLQTLASGDTVAVRLDLTDDEASSLHLRDTTSARKDHQPMTLLIFVTATILNDTTDTPKVPLAAGSPTIP